MGTGKGRVDSSARIKRPLVTLGAEHERQGATPVSEAFPSLPGRFPGHVPWTMRVASAGAFQIVANSLLHFDGVRYRMGDFVVMPNHVHLLAAFATADTMKQQCDSWLHYTAVHINRQLGEKGKFWQQEPFDHLVRSIEQFDYLRRYISENPRKANLKPGEYSYRRYEP
jgi:REP element-mobilizing transposase RayT